MPIEDLYIRSKEIGKALLRARKRSKKSMRECAEYIGTSRQRYAGFETAAVFVGAVELEALMRYLDIPPFEVWPRDLLGEINEVVLQTKPGKTLRILINVEEANDITA